MFLKAGGFRGDREWLYFSTSCALPTTKGPEMLFTMRAGFHYFSLFYTHQILHLEKNHPQNFPSKHKGSIIVLLLLHHIIIQNCLNYLKYQRLLKPENNFLGYLATMPETAEILPLDYRGKNNFVEIC